MAPGDDLPAGTLLTTSRSSFCACFSLSLRISTWMFLPLVFGASGFRQSPSGQLYAVSRLPGKMSLGRSDYVRARGRVRTVTDYLAAFEVRTVMES